MSAIATDRHAGLARRHRGLRDDRHARARGDEVADEPHTLDLDRHRERQALIVRGVLDLGPQRVAERRQDHRVLGERRERHRPGRREVERLGTSPTRSSSRRCSTTRRESLTGSVTTACESSRPATSAASRSDAPSVTRSESAGACSAQVGDDRGHEPAADRADRAEGRVAGLEALEHRDVGAQVRRARGGRGGPARARSSPNSVGTAPRRPRLKRLTPSSSSSWRIWSETFDCTVCRWSAAPVNDPASAPPAGSRGGAAPSRLLTHRVPASDAVM